MLIRDKKLVEFFGVLLLYIFSLARIITEFLDERYSADIDAYIYVGQEVRRGNPVWINEWTGPLLVQDFLFAIASPLGPAKTWLLVSVGSAVLSVVCVAYLLPGFLHTIGYEKDESHRAAILAGGIYLLVSGHMPSGFSHINVLPTSMAIIALLLAVRFAQDARGQLKSGTLVVLAGFAAAISISVRPYFIFPLALGFLLVCLVITSQKALSVQKKIVRVSSLLMSPTVIGLALNVGPLVYLGQGTQFFTRLGFFFQTPPSGQFSIMDVLAGVLDEISPLRFWLAGMLLFSLAEVFVGLWRRSNFLAVTLVPLSAIALAIGLESLHFWDHYINFFSWYFSIILSARIVFLDRVLAPVTRDSPARFAAPGLMLPFALSAFAAVVLLVGFGNPSETPKVTAISNEHRELAFATALEAKMLDDSTPRVTFFAPTSDYVHWKLQESRHGFPNSFMVNQIVSGRWETLPHFSYSFRTPKNADELCDEMLDSSIELVVLPLNYELGSLCFAEAKSSWRYELLQVSDAELWDLWWRE